MTVTFIAHSAFLVEWDKFYTLFDYTYEPDYTGALPELSGDKPLLVFSSHSHEDHFDAKVFTLLEKYPGAHFFVSRDTRLTERKRQWLNISDAAFARTTVLRPDSILLTDVAGEDLSIRAIKSTDIGNAYLLRCEGKMVYHGGDLNWWDWKSEGEAMPCGVTITMTGENAGYSRLYLHNAVSGKWQFLNSYKDGVAHADVAGEYLLTNQNLRFTSINSAGRTRRAQRSARCSPRWWCCGWWSRPRSA